MHMSDCLTPEVPRIRFRVLQPHHRIGDYIEGNAFLRAHPRWNAALQRWNTSVVLSRKQRRALRALDTIPRMTTWAVGAMLIELASQIPEGSVYLNIGVWHGYSLLCVMAGAPQCPSIGVDNFSEFGGPADAFMPRFAVLKKDHHHFFSMEYQQYFLTTHREPIGLYFYDGSHEYEDQRSALELAEPFFVPGTLIVVDDTNWNHPRRATEDFIAKSPRRYMRMMDVRTACNAHPTFWNGLMVFRCCS